jgi:hypothetical protein
MTTGLLLGNSLYIKDNVTLMLESNNFLLTIQRTFLVQTRVSQESWLSMTAQI